MQRPAARAALHELIVDAQIPVSRSGVLAVPACVRRIATVI
ncbi:hypothetical protein LC55x_2396 [Lysobacter capsici]|nr:hypothetical protein LC55x_2396 [Lysobacter capsici]